MFSFFNASQLARRSQTGVRPVSSLVGLQTPEARCLVKFLKFCVLGASLALLLALPPAGCVRVSRGCSAVCWNRCLSLGLRAAFAPSLLFYSPFSPPVVDTQGLERLVEVLLGVSVPPTYFQVRSFFQIQQFRICLFLILTSLVVRFTEISGIWVYYLPPSGLK